MAEIFEQGWSARPFKQQFPELSDSEADLLDKINEAITRLYMADCLTDSQKDMIRQKKFPKLVSSVISKARSSKATGSAA